MGGSPLLAVQLAELCGGSVCASIPCSHVARQVEPRYGGGSWEQVLRLTYWAGHLGKASRVHLIMEGRAEARTEGVYVLKGVTGFGTTLQLRP